MRLDVWLVGFNAGVSPAKALAAAFGLDMQEALMLELTLPTIVGRDLSEADAESAVRALRGIGGRAEARPVDPAAPLGFDLPFARNETAGPSSVPAAPEPSPAATPSAPPGPLPGDASEDELPSLPAPRRTRNASDGALDLRPPSGRPKAERPEKIVYRKDDSPLEVVDVERPKAAVQRSVQPKAARTSSFSIGRYLPALASLGVGAVCGFFTLRRGLTALLGTADILGHVLDAGAIVGVALAIVFGAAALYSDRDHLNLTPGALAVVIAAGAAFLLNEVRVPVVSAQSEVGGEAEGLITQSSVSLAGLDDAGARTLIGSLREAGAISIRGAAPVSFMGSTAFHGLAIELPPGPSSRARVVEAFRQAMARYGGSSSPEPAPAATQWLVAL